MRINIRTGEIELCIIYWVTYKCKPSDHAQKLFKKQFSTFIFIKAYIYNDTVISDGQNNNSSGFTLKPVYEKKIRPSLHMFIGIIVTTSTREKYLMIKLRIIQFLNQYYLRKIQPFVLIECIYNHEGLVATN